MGLYSGGFIIGRILASEIWGEGLIFGRAYLFIYLFIYLFFFWGGGAAYYGNFTVFKVAVTDPFSSLLDRHLICFKGSVKTEVMSS